MIKITLENNDSSIDEISLFEIKEAIGKYLLPYRQYKEIMNYSAEVKQYETFNSINFDKSVIKQNFLPQNLLLILAKSVAGEIDFGILINKLDQLNYEVIALINHTNLKYLLIHLIIFTLPGRKNSVLYQIEFIILSGMLQQKHGVL